MKLLAFGDAHLNERSGLGPERLRDQEDILREIFTLAHVEDVDAVLAAGDIWEHRRPTPAELRAFQRPLDEFVHETRTDVLAITGNHDVANADQPIALDLFRGLIDVHKYPSVWEARGVAVATLPWTPVSRLVAEAGGGDRDDVNAAAAEHLLAVANGLRAQIRGPAILLLHWSVSGASTPDGISTDLFREPVLDADELDAMGWDAIVMGHIHKPQMLGGGMVLGEIPRRPLATPGSRNTAAPFFYVGSPLPLNHGEAACDHGCWILKGPPFTARFVPLESRRFVTIDEEAIGAIELSDPEANRGFWPEQVPDGCIARLRYTATQEQARRIDNLGIRRALLEAGAWRATVEPTIVREERGRVEGLTADLSPAEAFRLWLDEEIRQGRVEERLRDLLIEANREDLAGVAR